jgi:hypothetical protein
MLLPMIEGLDIVEEDDMPVRHASPWRLRRRPAPRPAGQQRWDRAYLYLMQWTQRPVPTQPGQEDSHDGRVVCSRLEPAPDHHPNH